MSWPGSKYGYKVLDKIRAFFERIEFCQETREKEDLRSTCKCRRHNVQRHSYVFNEYVPDFENGCYRLQFQCEYCGDEIFDKVNDEYGGYYDGWKQTDTSEVATKYSKKQPEILVIYIQRIKLRGGGAVRIQHQEQRLEFNDN